jgi:excisionase family DNA binding protein
MPFPDRFATVREASDQLGYSVQHVRSLLRSGDLKGEKIGRDWVIDQASLDHMLTAAETVPMLLDGGVVYNQKGSQ